MQEAPKDTPPATPGGTPKAHTFIPQIRPRLPKLTGAKPPTVIRRPTSANSESTTTTTTTSTSSPSSSPSVPKAAPLVPAPKLASGVVPNFKRKSTTPDKPAETPSPQKKQRRETPLLPPLDESEKPQFRTMKQVIHSSGGKPMPKQSEEVILSQNRNERRPEPVAAASSGPSFVPQVRIVDGQVVLDESSLVIASVVDDSVDYSRIQDNTTRTTNAYRRKNTATDKWNKKETEKFYNALRQYGTDFTLLGLLFPTRSRRQIRNKFKKEEKNHPKKVDDALNNRIPIDVKKYKTLLTRAKDKVAEEQQQQQQQQPQPADGETTTEQSTTNADGETVTPAEDGTQQPTQEPADTNTQQPLPPVSKDKIVGSLPDDDEDEDDEEEEDMDGGDDKEENYDFPLHY